MAFSIYDASVPICAQQLGALAVIAGKAADHCATNKIEEAALLTDRLYPDMFCLARQFRQAADFGRMTPGRLAGVAGPEFAAVDDTSFAAAKKRCEDSVAFINSLTRAQIVDGRRRRAKDEGYRLPATIRFAELLFLRHDCVRHPAASRSGDRQAGLPRPGELALRPRNLPPGLGGRQVPEPVTRPH
jgi:hypothetical protein